MASVLLLLRSDAPASAANSITSPDNGEFPSLALDASGNPVVAYFDDTNDDLKILHCDDPNCAPGGDSITSPDSVGSVGLNSSLALDADGRPVVAYLDFSGARLKVLHCNDPNCAGGGESVTSPDHAGPIAPSISLALVAEGNPVVSYHSDTDRDLKVLHCNDPNCAPGGDSITSPDPAGDGSTSIALDLRRQARGQLSRERRPESPALQRPQLRTRRRQHHLARYRKRYGLLHFARFGRGGQPGGQLP